MNKTYKGVRGEHVVSRVGGFLVVQTKGLFSPETVEELRALVRAELMASEAVKVLCDLRRAVVIIGEDGWRRVRRESLESTPLSAPVGILTSPASFEPLLQHCWAMAKAGRTRYAFSNLRGAVDWLGADLNLSELPEFQPVSGFDA